MMLQVFGYAIAVAAALSLVGLAEARLGRAPSRRWFWVLAMVLSVSWPLAMLLWNPSPAVALQQPVAFVPPPTEAVTPPEVLVAAEPVGALPPESKGLQPVAAGGSPISDRALFGVWAVLSGGLLLYLVLAGVLLARRATRWSRAEILGREVLVSESTGPALVGVLRPKIVVPRWFLDEPAARQALILQHEEQHMAAHDPLLFRAALLIAVALPWNLPLWWQLRRLRQAIELDCDARVLRGGAEPDTYGEVLLEVTRRSSDVPVGAVAMGEPVSALERRVRSLVADPRRPVWRGAAALLLLGGGIAAAAALDAPQLPAGSSAAVQTNQDPGAAAEQEPARTPEQLRAAQEQLRQRLQVVQGAASGEQLRAIVERQLALQERATRENQALMGAQARTREEGLAAGLSELAAAERATRMAAEAALTPDAPDAPDDRPTMDLRDLITMAGGKFRKQFIVDPRVRGSVNVDSLAIDRLTYHTFLQVLGVHGFVAVPSADVVTIIPEAMATRVASPIVDADDIKGDDAEVVTALIQVKENPMQLNPILRQIVPQWGFVQAMPDGKSLLVVDRVANIKRIVALVKAQEQAQ